ncbi:hypothetical protein A33Q_1181 [Indibacter alkaliphilus LW1]|uniref:HTH cro/C1-type domain-containing protein n=1 Tax=Indibacter alkaliphilus (strain CCUG 57479 / KCTC 22604 / LW1) TaxID=1189612 RepID=S2DHN7_INDAL|nr:helix-turn-helix domain-containing protein [Indibacter alkaliphilus]EOZ98527.1 hypothetical protein A33Q_1181 [Indibacter alkaliphilus LW1]
MLFSKLTVLSFIQNNNFKTQPMVSSDIQVQFFQYLKSLLPPYKSLVDEISDLLDISNDSAYRRIRGEKFIDLDEIKKISQYFNVSLDQLFNLQTDAIVFQGKLNKYDNLSFDAWLDDMQAQLEMVNSHKNKHIYFLVKDMPPFYHFYQEELANFKFFFWKKSILHYDNLKGIKFSLEEGFTQKYKEACSKITRLYNKIPSTEIWNVEGINTTLRQIDLYTEMGIIQSVDVSKKLYQCMLEIVDHLEKMAEKGKKFGINQEPSEDSLEFRMFVNEFIIGDNTFMAEVDSVRITYLNHSVLYFLGSRDPKFNDSMFVSLENLVKKSTMISSIGEKERNQFFNKLRKKILLRMEALV